jgi:hypothetical protein
VLAADKGSDAKDQRRRLRTRGSRPQIPKRGWKRCKPRGRPIKKDVPRYQAERTIARLQRKYRRLVVRWERLAACFNAFLAIAMIHMLRDAPGWLENILDSGRSWCRIPDIIVCA